jgi:hypothetical protein
VEDLRRCLQDQQQALRQQLDNLHRADARADALVAYCKRVLKQLHAFTFEEKRLALDAFDIQATWGAGEGLKIRVGVPEQAFLQQGDGIIANIALRSNDTCNN